MPISSQYTTSPTNVRSVYYLSCPCPFTTQSLLPTSSQNTCNLSCSSQVSTPSHLAMSSQFMISPAHVQSVHYFNCPFPFSTPYLLPISSQYTTSPAQVSNRNLCHNPFFKAQTIFNIQGVIYICREWSAFFKPLFDLDPEVKDQVRHKNLICLATTSYILPNYTNLGPTVNI